MVRHISSPRGAITLGQVADRGGLRMQPYCLRCDRRGDYSIARLIERHGRETALVDVNYWLSADCPRRKRASIYDRCDVLCDIAPPEADPKAWDRPGNRG